MEFRYEMGNQRHITKQQAQDHIFDFSLEIGRNGCDMAIVVLSSHGQFSNGQDQSYHCEWDCFQDTT